jgi:large subunit ribosomal protein L3
MTIGVVGRKCGMTRIFQEDGTSVPVTVIHVEPNIVTQLKTTDVDGYDAVQVTTGVKKRSKMSKPMLGHFAKANVEPGRGLWEFPVDAHSDQIQVGSQILVSLFEAGQFVDVAGTSKGKGFAGVIKRYHFSMQDATHGNSRSHRAPGSTGQRQSPGRVFKNKRMAGHMGDVRCTLQSLRVIKVDAERNLLLVKGGVPGAPGGSLVVLPAVKKSGGAK